MKYVQENLTLTRFTEFLNTSHNKKNGKIFTTGDVQGYIKRMSLPKYLGGNDIEESNIIKGVKLYNIKK